MATCRRRSPAPPANGWAAHLQDVGIVTVDMVLVVLALASGLSFLHYGFEILSSVRLRQEFARYGLPGLRVLVGLLEMAGGAAVLLGLAHAPLGALAAAGLTLLMIIGLTVRIRLRDAPRLMVPAGTLAVLNAVLVVLFLGS